MSTETFSGNVAGRFSIVIRVPRNAVAGSAEIGSRGTTSKLSATTSFTVT